MDKIDILQKYSFYYSATLSVQRELEEAGMAATLNPGEFYFHEGDVCSQIALIGEGSIRVYKSGESGREITLYHVRSGETCILTASCVLAGVRYPATAEVESRINAVVFPAATFREWIATKSKVQEFIFKTLAARMADVMALVEEITFNKMDRRLAEFLLHSFLKASSPTAILKLTHERIATELGSAREVMSRLLKELERLGAIDLARGHIHLKDEKVLRKQVNFAL